MVFDQSQLCSVRRGAQVTRAHLLKNMNLPQILLSQFAEHSSSRATHPRHSGRRKQGTFSDTWPPKQLRLLSAACAPKSAPDCRSFVVFKRHACATDECDESTWGFEKQKQTREDGHTVNCHIYTTDSPTCSHSNLLVLNSPWFFHTTVVPSCCSPSECIYLIRLIALAIHWN